MMIYLVILATVFVVINIINVIDIFITHRLIRTRNRFLIRLDGLIQVDEQEDRIRLWHESCLKNYKKDLDNNNIEVEQLEIMKKIWDRLEEIKK